LKIEIKDEIIEDHIIEPNQKVIEISDESGLVAKIIPTKKEIVVISKYYKEIIPDLISKPAKIYIQLDRSKED